MRRHVSREGPRGRRERLSRYQAGSRGHVVRCREAAKEGNHWDRTRSYRGYHHRRGESE